MQGKRPHLHGAEGNSIRLGVVIPSIAGETGDGVQEAAQGTRIGHVQEPAAHVDQRRLIKIIQRVFAQGGLGLRIVRVGFRHLRRERGYGAQGGGYLRERSPLL